jgi:hypothetical protein
MLNPDHPLTITLTAADMNTVLAAIGELPYRIANPIMEKVRQQVLAIDPEAFTQPGQTSAAPPTNALNGSVAQYAVERAAYWANNSQNNP